MDINKFKAKQEQELAEFKAKQEAAAAANAAREERRKKAEREFDEFKNKSIFCIMDEYDFTEKQANIIFNHAWEDGHSYGFNEVTRKIDDLCDFINDVINANK